MDSLRNMLGKSMMLIDAGNVHSLKKGGRYDREAGFIIDVMNRQDYDLSVLGPKDFVLADSSLRPMLKQSKFKWIGSNFPSKDRPRGVRDYVIQKVDGVKVGVFSYVDPGYRQNNMDSSRVTDNLVETARYLREKCDVVVLVAHTNNREPEPLAQRVPEVDLLVLGGVTNPWRTMKQDSTVYIGNSGDRGRHIARFELLLNREKSIVESKYELVKLKHEVPRDPEVVRQMGISPPTKSGSGARSWKPCVWRSWPNSASIRGIRPARTAPTATWARRNAAPATWTIITPTGARAMPAPSAT